MTGRFDARDGEDGLGEPGPLRAHPGDGLGSLGTGQLVCRREADRAGDVLRPGATMTLLGPALLLGEDVRPVSDVQDADALRALELVRPQRHEIRAERLDVEIDGRRRLDRIDVDGDALARPDARDELGDRLDRADLVVGEHDRDEDRPVVELRLELVRVHPPVPVDRQLDDLEAELLEVAEGVPDRVMFDRRGDDPVAAGLAGPGRALQREVVRLGPARGEDDLAAAGVEPGGDALVGLIEPGPGATAEAVRRARVPERPGHVRQHGVEDLAAERGRRRVIEIDRHGPDRTPDPCREPCARVRRGWMASTVACRCRPTGVRRSRRSPRGRGRAPAR